MSRDINDPRIAEILRIVKLLSEDGRSYDGPGLDAILSALCFQLLPGGDHQQAEVVAIFAALLPLVRTESLSLMHLEAFKQERIHREMLDEWARADADEQEATVQ